MPDAEEDAASEEARHRFLTEPVVRPVDNRDNCSPCLYALLSRCERGQCIRGTDKDWTRVTPPGGRMPDAEKDRPVRNVHYEGRNLRERLTACVEMWQSTGPKQQSTRDLLTDLVGVLGGYDPEEGGNRG